MPPLPSAPPRSSPTRCDVELETMGAPEPTLTSCNGTRSCAAKVAAVALVVQFGLCTEPASAQSCVASSHAHTNTNQLKKFKVNTEGWAKFGIDRSAGASGDGDVLDSTDQQLSADELIGAAILAAGIWNDHGNAGTFQFDGTTDLTELQDTQALCDTAGHTYSIIVFSEDDSNTTAIADDECGGSQFKITVWPRLISTEVRSFWNRWENITTPPSGQYIRDVAGVLVHELGHTQGLGHPATEECVMGNFDNDVRKRDLYRWDFYCSESLSGLRALTAYRMNHSDTLGFVGPTAFSGTHPVTKAAGGVTFDGSTVRSSAAFHRGSQIAWDENADGTGYVGLSNPSTINGIGFVPAFFQEDSNQTDRVFYSYWDDAPTDHDAESEHFVRQIRSTNEFSSQTAGSMFECTAMSGATCTNSDEMQSRSNVAVAWVDGSVDTSVVAWVHQEHSGDGTSTDANEIRIALGYEDDDTLSIPLRTGLKSAVAPGLACKENFSGSHDCILAYVPMTSMTNQIETAGYRCREARSPSRALVTRSGVQGPHPAMDSPFTGTAPSTSSTWYSAQPMPRKT